MLSETRYEQKYNRLPQFSLWNEKKQKKEITGTEENKTNIK